MTLAAALALWLTAAPPAMGAPARVPVPPELLQGATLVDPKHNFSIVAPAADWTWSYQTNEAPPGVLYVCESPNGQERLLAIVFTMAVPVRDGSRFVAGFVKGFRRSTAERGVTVAPDFHISSVDLPAPGSYRFEGEVTVPPIGQAHTYGYIYLSASTYVFQQYTTEAVEPATLGNFVRSFKLLPPVAPPGRMPDLVARILNPSWRDVRDYGAGTFYLLVVVLLVLAQPFFARVARPPFDNAGAIAAGVVGLLVVARCALGAMSGATAYEQGTYVGQGLIALIVAVVIASRYSRKPAGAACPRCGRAIPSGGRFCGSCGSPLITR